MLGIYPDKTIIQKGAHILMLITALFIIAMTWRQPKCPLTDEWIKKLWYIYTMEYYSTIKNEIMPFAGTWMQVVLVVKNPPVTAGDARETGLLPAWGRSPGVGSGNCSSILAWKIRWTDEPGGIQSIGLHGVGFD